ncbi:hypothetical protein E1258_09505 [Micromonospora sp. KC207]|uniref:hypothetical protein n=1 Tax=Micromonospora sp. KC207 TaxID=2530377 RepID=UPI001051A7FE|nr:hypothetical protein [Micromonospora sp. KC207]TDC63872.1 hypothetical protein E1258_09505 [Micromonospora sp. KC207]
MTIDFFAGQVPTADELLALAPGYVAQGSSQAVTSSTTLVDSAIVVPVNGLSMIDLAVRYTALAGGMRWAWSVTGTVTMLSRSILSAGESTSTTAGTANIADYRLRQIATATEEQTTAQFNNASTQLIREWLIVDGVGDVTFRFAQQASNASATTLNAASFATVERLRQL